MLAWLWVVSPSWDETKMDRSDWASAAARASLAATLTGALAGALALAACQKPADNSAAAANTAANAASSANSAAANAALASNSAAVAVADAADATDVKAYLDGLYAHYKTSKNNNFDMFGRNGKEVFDDSMLALLKADTLALKGDLGVIDGDWLCDCQDFVSLKATVTVLSATPTSATARSDFLDTGMSDQGMRHASFDLVKENGAWRIHDIVDSQGESIRKELTDDIKQLKSPGKTSDPNTAP
jgi:hypothetical protein